MVLSRFLLARLIGQYCFARWRLSSSSVVCNTVGGRAGQSPGARIVERPTLHGGPVVLRPVRATYCFGYFIMLVGLLTGNPKGCGQIFYQIKERGLF